MEICRRPQSGIYDINQNSAGVMHNVMPASSGSFTLTFNNNQINNQINALHSQVCQQYSWHKAAGHPYRAIFPPSVSLFFSLLCPSEFGLGNWGVLTAIFCWWCVLQIANWRFMWLANPCNYLPARNMLETISRSCYCFVEPIISFAGESSVTRCLIHQTVK